MNLAGSIVSQRTNTFHRIPELQRIQQVLRGLLIILLTFSIIDFFCVIYSLSRGYRTSTYEPIPFLCWILFFAFGLFVTENYCFYGILVFAWLGIVNILLTCTAIVLITVGVVLVTSQGPRYRVAAPSFVIPIVVYLICVILDAITVIIAFHFAYRMKKHQRANTRPRMDIALL